MGLEIYWEPAFPYIITTALWIFSYIALIVWAKNTKKQGTHTKHINFLQIVGILILVWDVLYFFLPSVRITYSPFPTELDFLIYNLIYFIKVLISNLLFVLLGIALTIYVNKNYALEDKKAIIGPVLYLVGIVSFLLLNVSSYLLFTFLNPIYDAIYEIFIFTDPVLDLLLVAGTCLLLWFSIRLNRDFFSFFASLLLASTFVSFLFEINYVSWFVYYWL